MMTEITARRRHRWFERTPLPVRDEATGCERHERVCELCHITRTTVIPPQGFPWVEWVTEDGIKTVDGKTPICTGTCAPVERVQT